MTAALASAATAEPFPAAIALPSLLPEFGGDGSVGFVLQRAYGEGEAAIGSGAGDLNDDGVDDIVIGTRFGDYAYVVFGRNVGQSAFPAAFELTSLLPGGGGDGTAGFALHGPNGTGWAVSGAGDVNGDGIADVMIDAYFGAPREQGEIFVVFGRDTAQAGDYPALLELSSLLQGDGSQGFVLVGVKPGDHAGPSLSAAGDVNGDGIDDMIIGAYRADAPTGGDVGQTYVVFGRDTAQAGNFPPVMPLSSLLPPLGDGSAGFVLLGILENDQSGNAVGGAVDMNGDGIDDIIIGAHHRDVGTRHYAGQAYVVYGRDTARTGNFPAAFPLADLLPDAGGDGTGGFVLNGINADDTAGQSVSTAGDINGDGIGDLVIGAPQADPQGRISAGQSYVVFGRNAAVVGSFPPVFALSSLLPTGGGDGSAGFVIAGRREDHSGYALSAAGDVNSDGTADLLIGAPGDNPRPGGRAYVLYGRDTAQTGDFPAVFGLGTLFRGAGGDGSEGFVLAGIRVGDNVGLSVDALGDVNDDGMDDMIVGTIGTDGGVSACSVIYGRSQSP